MNALQDTVQYKHKVLAISLEAQIWQIIYWQTFVPYWIHSV